jgi:hypothetical protein
MRTLFALLLMLSPALADEFVPPDVKLWEEMKQAMSQINMPLSAHQAVQQVLMNVEVEAQRRAKAKGEKDAK